MDSLPDKVIVLISGKAQHGKDTCAKILCDAHGFVRYAFADELKRTATAMGWNGQKDEHGRRLLQELGAVGRTYDQNIWVNKVLEKLKAKNEMRAVVSDCRFPNEIECVRKFGEENGYSTVFVRVDRPGYKAPGMTPEAEADPSETSLDAHLPDVRLVNDGSEEDLAKKISKEMRFLSALPDKKSFPGKRKSGESVFLNCRSMGPEDISRIVKNGMKISGKKLLITSDFDDTLLVKTNRFSSRTDALAKILGMEDVSVVIVTARDGSSDSTYEDITKFCKDKGLRPDFVIVGAGDKASLLEFLSPAFHLEDEPGTVRKIVRETNVPVLSPGEFFDENYILGEWLPAIRAEIGFYSPDGVEEFVERRMSVCGAKSEKKHASETKKKAVERDDDSVEDNAVEDSMTR